MDRRPSAKDRRPGTAGLLRVNHAYRPPAQPRVSGPRPGRRTLELCDDPDRDDWRAFYHGEHGPTYHFADATQSIVDERTKYIWNPVTGDEFLFDLVDDPGETTNLAAGPDHEEETVRWRTTMVEHLADRPEGFSDGNSLQTVDPNDGWG